MSCLQRWIKEGISQRRIASTNMNSQSSRSHGIFTIRVSHRRAWERPSDVGETEPRDADLDEKSQEVIDASMHLVDLAGKYSGIWNSRGRVGISRCV